MRVVIAIALCILTAGCAATGGSAAAGGGTGTRHRTDRNLDLAIDGEGYFIVQTPAGGYLFTRNGALSVSSSGELANEDGYILWPRVAVPEGGSSLTITPDGQVRRMSAAGADEFAGQIVLSRFENADGLERDGVYFMPTNGSGEPITGKPSTKGLGTIVVGELQD